MAALPAVLAPEKFSSRLLAMVALSAVAVCPKYSLKLLVMLALPAEVPPEK